jgi:hypothetical protein
VECVDLKEQGDTLVTSAAAVLLAPMRRSAAMVREAGAGCEEVGASRSTTATPRSGREHRLDTSTSE